MVLPLYGHANRFGQPESKRVLNVVQFDCNSIRLPGPDDVTWRVMCAIVYIAADSTSTVVHKGPHYHYIVIYVRISIGHV